jgi:hypothetical protein
LGLRHFDALSGLPNSSSYRHANIILSNLIGLPMKFLLT